MVVAKRFVLDNMQLSYEGLRRTLDYLSRPEINGDIKLLRADYDSKSGSNPLTGTFTVRFSVDARKSSALDGLMEVIKGPAPREEVYAILLNRCGLSVKTQNVISRYNWQVKTIGDLYRAPIEQLRTTKMYGKTCEAEIRQMMQRHGLNWGESVADDFRGNSRPQKATQKYKNPARLT